MLALTRSATACDCVPKELQAALEDPLPRSKMVFLGEVMEINRFDGANMIKFKIRKSWKGTEGVDVMMKTPLSDCGLGSLVLRSEVLVISVGGSRNGYTSCDTQILPKKSAGPLIAKLNAIKR